MTHPLTNGSPYQLSARTTASAGDGDQEVLGHLLAGMHSASELALPADVARSIAASTLLNASAPFATEGRVAMPNPAVRQGDWRPMM